MPIVQLSLAIRELATGELIRVEAQDPAFLTDLEAWARMTGNELLEVLGGDVQQATVRKTQ